MAEKGSELSLDELLTEQDKTVFLGTIEKTEDANLLKITPYSADAGCQCGSSLRLPKASVERVVSTGITHQCCGKRLLVVEIFFKNDASIPIAELLAQRLPSSPHSLEGEVRHHHPMQMPPAHFQSPQEPPLREPPGGYGEVGPSIVCPFGYTACRGRCGERCYKPSAGESCRDGQVCPFGYSQCGCSCYKPSAGETCYRGRVVQQSGPLDDQGPQPRSGCYACSTQHRCYRQCWDENGNWYWRYDRVCC